MEVLYSTGIRLNELLHLTVYVPDFKGKSLLIHKGKGRKQRIVPLGKSSIRYLKEYLEKIRPRYAAKNPKERKLFLTNDGKALQPAPIRQAVREYRIKAGIEKRVSPPYLQKILCNPPDAAGSRYSLCSGTPWAQPFINHPTVYQGPAD